MPCDYKKYPKDWKTISANLRLAVGNRCELCYAPNGATVARNKNHQYPWQYISEFNEGEPRTKIILTVHHIDGDLSHNTHPNLIVLCQRCHLRLDLAKHMQKRKNK